MPFVNTEEAIGSEALVNAFLDGSLTELLDDRITKIKAEAFADSNELVSVSLPNNTTVGSSAFARCPKLQYVDIGYAKSIPSYAFQSCSALAIMVIRTGSVCVLNTTGNSLDKCTFYVPSDLVEAYKVATNWSNFADRIRAIEDYPEITGGL